MDHDASTARAPNPFPPTIATAAASAPQPRGGDLPLINIGGAPGANHPIRFEVRMEFAVGVDVGSTTAKAVVVDGAGTVRWQRCERHHGRPHELAQALVDAARAEAPRAPLGLTGSIGSGLAGELGPGAVVHEVHAVVRVADARGMGARTLIELGGQDAKIVTLDEARRADTQMNDKCAAGTGATLDRVVRRLGLCADDVANARARDDLRVSARCGVFAETDAINLVQRGERPTDVFGALATAIVRQNLAVLARGRRLAAPVVLIGGPHVHVPALAEAWREVLLLHWRDRDLAPGPVLVPGDGQLFAAIGAALHARAHPFASREPATKPRRPLAAVPVGLVPRSAPAPETRARSTSAGVHVGLDCGSTSVKGVLLDDTGAVVAQSYAIGTGRPLEDLRARLAELLAGADEPVVRSVGVTGYGAALAREIVGADLEVVETVAHARAAVALDPATDAIVDVGGTDVKVLQLRAGEVVDFHVSNQCAAGHGALLATLGAELGVGIDDLAALALGARRAPAFTVGCAVFMDADRVGFARDGYAAPEILAGLSWAIVRSIWEFVVAVPPASLGRRFVLTGGVHRNASVIAAEERYLADHVPGASVRVHPHPELCGAIGAALAAHDAQVGPSRFAGLRALRRTRLELVRGEVRPCDRCANECERTVVRAHDGGGGRVVGVVGNACERGADEHATGRRSRDHAPDLLAEEGARLFRRLLDVPRETTPLARAPRIAIPRVMGLYRCAPLLLHYLRAAGWPDDAIVLGPPTSAALYERGAGRGRIDPCFPAKLVGAHVAWALDAHRRRALDAILVPTVTHAAIDVTGTEDTASCPIVAACGHTARAAFADSPVPIWSPDLHLARRERLREQLWSGLAEPAGVSRDAHERAFAHAIAAQRRFTELSQARGRRVLGRAVRAGKAVAVVLARPYHSDPGVTHGLGAELASLGIALVSLCSLPREVAPGLDVGPGGAAITNSGSAEKLWAARTVAAHPNLVAVEVSSFRCGQDASMYGTLADVLGAADKPFLRLGDLDESRPAASFRLRVETFADAVDRYARRALSAAREDEVRA